MISLKGELKIKQIKNIKVLLVKHQSAHLLLKFFYLFYL